MTKQIARPTILIHLAAILALLLPLSTAEAQFRAEPPDDETRQAIINGIREHAHSLKSPADLDPILELTHGRRAVLLGEASHGTEEYYAWRMEISKRLITEQGFRFIAVEGDWAACAAVNRYVKHIDPAPPTARDALESFTRWPGWLWNNQVTLDLVEWLREHNASLPADQRVGFYGIDVYGMDQSFKKTTRYVERLDKDVAEEVNAKYDCFRPHIENIRQYLFQVQTGNSCEDELRAVVDLIRSHRDEWQQRDPHAYFHAKQNALVVKNAESHYRLMIRRDHQSWNARATHFFLTLQRLLEFYGEDARGIVWAHNTHIGDARATNMAQQRQVNIGQLARESLGREAVALIGFSTHRGQVVAGAQWESPKQIMPVAPGHRGSLEDIMINVNNEPFLFIMDDVSDIEGLNQRIGHRAIGVTFDPRMESRNYVPTVLAERYDAFIFIPVTNALKSVRAQRSGEGENSVNSQD